MAILIAFKLNFMLLQEELIWLRKELKFCGLPGVSDELKKEVDGKICKKHAKNTLTFA